MHIPRNLVLGTAGHIDHGKSALVRALTGVDTDRLPAEKARGITIDLGFAALSLGSHRLAVVDVPGHERFVRNMLAGASGMDLALLVVAADDSIMPQTREHLEILRLLGLAGGVIALTKCDLADPDWLGLVEDDVRSLVSGTFLDGSEIVRTSAATGMGLDALKRALGAAAETCPIRPDPGGFRMAIDRGFTRSGHGAVATGTIASGEVREGDDLMLMPEGRPVRVRGLHRHGAKVERAGRGARAAINLGGVHHDEIRRGQELATPGYLVASRILTVELSASHDAPRAIRHRGRYRLHLGTAEVAASVSLLGPNALGPGETVLAQVSTAEPVAGVFGQPFILREESPPATLGGGRVLQPTAGRVRRRDRAAIDRLERLRSADPATRAAAAIAFAGIGPPGSALDVSRAAGIVVDDVPTVLDSLARGGRLVEMPVGPRRTAQLAAEAVDRLEDRVLRALGRLHEARPRQTTIRRSSLPAELPDLASEALLSGVVERLKAAGKVVGDRQTIALADFQPKLSHTERKLKADLLDAIQQGGFRPPDASELAAGAGPRAGVVPELLALLVDEGRIVEVGGGTFFDVEAESTMKRLVADRLAGDATMTMADLRDLLGTTRKFAVPIGEYLDRIGLTRRDGDVRRLGTAPTEVSG